MAAWQCVMQGRVVGTALGSTVSSVSSVAVANPLFGPPPEAEKAPAEKLSGRPILSWIASALAWIVAGCAAIALLTKKERTSHTSIEKTLPVEPRDEYELADQAWQQEQLPAVGSRHAPSHSTRTFLLPRAHLSLSLPPSRPPGHTSETSISERSTIPGLPFGDLTDALKSAIETAIPSIE